MKITGLLLSSILLLGGVIFPMQSVRADSNVSVVIDGKSLSFSQPPVIIEGTTLVPLRGIFEALGATVTWDDQSRTVHASKEGTEISLQIGSKTALKNNQQTQLEVPAQIINDTTMVPARFIGESLGCIVKWDEKNHAVLITTFAPAEPIKMINDEDSSKNIYSVADIGKHRNSVVFVEIYDKNGNPIAGGSGLVVTSNGGILTNYHIIKNGAGAKIVFSDHTVYNTVQLLNENPEKDLAYLKIDAINLQTVEFGNSSNTKQGDSVVAVDAPVGPTDDNFLGKGIVNTLDRKVNGIDYIQTTAPTDHSGGALFNMHGHVIGMISAGIETQAVLNLAIPSTVITDFLNSAKVPKDMYQTAPDPQKNVTITNASDLTDYLNKNRSYLVYKNTPLHVSYTADLDNYGHYHIDIMIRDPKEYLNLLKQNQQERGICIPLMLTNAGLKVADITKDTQPQANFWYDDNFDSYPEFFPAKSITTNKDGTYHVFYNEGRVFVDMVKRTASYYVNPMENSNDAKTVNLDDLY